MNTEQIIKALECCFVSKSCEGCPYECGDSVCIDRLKRDALALIKELQGQIVGLNSAIETLQGVAKDYEHHNENLKKENKYLRERLKEEAEHKEDMGEKLVAQIKISEQELKKIVDPHIEEIKSSIELDIKAIEADTVKKMQERFIAEIEQTPNANEHFIKAWKSKIDQIAIEILEGG